MPASADIKLLAEQIEQVYTDADYVGSLVVPSAVDRQRPTAWYGMSEPTRQPRCEDFPGLVERGICWLDQTAGLVVLTVCAAQSRRALRRTALTMRRDGMRRRSQPITGPT
jgi:hypothetical protein